MNLFLRIFLIAILPAMLSCNDQENVAGQYSFFDVGQFFKQETSRLEKKNPVVDKNVVHNNQSEQKKLRISDWSKELELFSSSAINKPSWRNSYRKEERAGLTIYHCLDPDLRTRKIIIARSGNKSVKRIYIFNQVSNALYSSTEELYYYPDSLYQITKTQTVRLLGTNRYHVTGKFIPYPISF